jgi:hypothetical protein
VVSVVYSTIAREVEVDSACILIVFRAFQLPKGFFCAPEPHNVRCTRVPDVENWPWHPASTGRECAAREALSGVVSGNFSCSVNRGQMIRLLFTILVCGVTSSQATAQNKVSQTLLGLSENQRNESFTYLLRDNNVKCDQVIRTLFNGATSELDVWEVLCRDRNSYSLSILPDLSADIELVSCRELLATRKMLLKRAGRKSKATGCRIKPTEGLHRR